MRPPYAFVAAVLPLLFACSPDSARAASDSQDEALPEARALVERFLAVTRHEVVARSQSRHERARIALPEGEGRIERFARRPAEARQRTDLGPHGSFENGITDGRAWLFLSEGGATLLEGLELAQARLDGAYDAATRPATELEALTTLARVSFEGVDCWKVAVVARAPAGFDAEATRAARTVHEYYEVASGLLRGQEGLAAGELARGPYTRLFADYREFAGTLVPARVTLRKDGVEIVTTLEALAFDTVRDEDLAPPEAVRGLFSEALAPPAR